MYGVVYISRNLWEIFDFVIINIYVKNCSVKKSGRDSINYYGLHYEIIEVVDKVFSNCYVQMGVTMRALYIIIPIYKKLFLFVKGENE